MSKFFHKELVIAQLNETKRLLSFVEDEILMSISLKQRIKELESELNFYPEELTEPKVRLLFSGTAVKGSIGIKTSFISKAMLPFQELVKTQTALIRHGNIGKRGKSKGTNYSELYLTGLPRGSFGVELSQMESTDLFSEEDVSQAIANVINIVEATTKDDESFDEIIDSIPARNLNSLKLFLKNIDEEDSILKIESGSRELEISKEQIHQGYERVNHHEIEDREVFLIGTLRGVLLEGGIFEFIDESTGYTYKGHVGPDLPEEKIENMLNKHCKVHLKESRTHFISGKSKTLFELLDVMPI